MTDTPLIHRNTPSWNGLRTASIGAGAFESVEAGAAFLHEAGAILRAEGFEAVVGPMDGNTWGKYRLPSWSDGSPGFTMEPTAGVHDLEAYGVAGFGVVEQHVSATAAPGLHTLSRPRAQTFVVEQWDGSAPEHLLRDAYATTMTAFAKAPFFVPIPEAAFIASYMQFLGRVPPRFVLRARTQDGQPTGFALTFPDPFRTGALVFKTYAGTVPGAGRAMAERIHLLAAEEGFQEVIWALMRCGIASETQSRKFGARVFRGYSLMGKTLL